jgi:hypothetical protein
MRRRSYLLIPLILAQLALVMTAASPSEPSDKELAGSWQLVKERSMSVDPWRSMALTIETADDRVTVYRDLMAGRDSRKDTLVIPTDGQTMSTVVPESKKWLEQPHLGVFFDGMTEQHVSGTWLRPGKELMATVSTTLQTSQAAAPVEIIRRFIVSEDGTELTVLETRSSRPRPINLVFERQ